MKTLIAVGTCCLAFLFLTCSNPSSGNGSDVGNAKTGLIGHLVDGRTGNPADSAIVRLYPVYLNKMAKALGKTATGAPALDSTMTDQNGYYKFDSLSNNIYSVEAEKIDGSDTLTMRCPSFVFVDYCDKGWDTLQLPGSIRGRILVPSGESAKNITCYIPGTSYIAITNDTGGFRITGIPAGTYSLSTSSTKFNDTTIYGIKVTPNHETNVGYIALGLDRSKNEHDVWGVFAVDSVSAKAIDSIVARVSGDSIPIDSPRIYKLDWRPSLLGYSGFIYVPDAGFFWTIDVWVYDTAGHRIGAYRVPTINRATGDVEVPTFDPFNSIPVITLNDTTLSINDTIRLSPAISKLSDDSIVSMAWKIGSTGTFTAVTNKDTILIAPEDSTQIQCAFRVTDKFGNSATFTALVTVIIDPPTAEAGNDTVVSIKDTIRLHGTGTDQFGRIVKWEWDIGAHGNYVRTSSGDTAIIAPSVEDSFFTCVLRVTDDDSNKVTDTVHIQVLKDAPGLDLGPDTIMRVTTAKTFIANVQQQFGTIVMYIWKYVGSEATWTDSGSTMSSKPVTFNSLGEKKVICHVRDDDGNETADTVKIVAVTEIGGVLPMNAVLLESASPYAVTSDLLVQTGGKLTIEPGTTVRWGAGITVNGTLDAEGTSSNRVVFTANTFDTTSNGGGIFLQPGSTCRLKYCDITNGGIGSNFPSYAPDTIILDSCMLKNTGINAGGAYGMIRGCTFLGSNIVCGCGNWDIEGNSFVSIVNGPQCNLVLPWGSLGLSANISSNHFVGGGSMDIFGNGLIINNIVENSTGNGIAATNFPGSWAILNNTISNCLGTGILVTSYGYPFSGVANISHNKVTGNGFGDPPSSSPYFNAGIVCSDIHYIIDSNIVANNNIGVICSSGDTLTNNNIHDNTSYDFRVLVNDAGDITAPNNWWGTTDTAAIQAKIYDYNEDNGVGRLLIDPIATDSIPGAGVK